MGWKKFFLVSFSIFCFLWLPTLALSQEFQGLGDLQHTLNAKGARWEAGETSMTRLSPEERQKRLGLVSPVHGAKEPLLSLEAAPLLTLPTGLDWRNNGGNFVTPVRDQGGCGSCWAFSSTAALESNTLISNQAPGIDLNLSEQVLVSCGGAGSCGGGSPSSASNFLRNTGLPVESCYPYTANNGACSSACSNWQSSTYRISNWHYVTTTSPTVDALRNALYTYGPLVTTMEVYQDFFAYQSGVYHYVSGSYAGGHGVLLVGYDDVNQCFIAKNSWGTGWGESGFFRIAYSELNSQVGFGDYSIAYEGTPACSYNASQPSPSSFSASGGNGSVSVNTASNCPWTATSNDAWIVITSGASGTGNGTVYFSVSVNTGSSRTGTLRVAGQTLSVTQNAASCTYSLNPTQQDFGSAGGSGSIGITVGSGCTWTAQSNAGWLTITAGSTGSGSGTTVYSVATNSNPPARTGTMTVAGQTFTVIQSAPVRYALSITKSGTGTGTVTPNPAGTTFNAGTVVALTAAPDASSTFAGWSGGCIGTSPNCSVTVNSNTSVTATFSLKTFTINATAGMNGSISPQGTITLNYGSSQTFTITPASGYQVYDVQVDGVSTGSATSYQFSNAASNHTIAAYFVALPTSPDPSTVVLGIKAGGSDYITGNGIHYLGDRYFTGGATGTTGSAITGTGDASLYQTSRTGSFSYAIPLPNGNYDLTLKFAETTHSSPGQRVFDVRVEGTTVLKDFDIYSLTGGNATLDLAFTVSVTGGILNIQFVPTTGDAQINALLISTASSIPKSAPGRIKRYHSTQPR